MITRSSDRCIPSDRKQPMATMPASEVPQQLATGAPHASLIACRASLVSGSEVAATQAGAIFNSPPTARCASSWSADGYPVRPAGCAELRPSTISEMGKVTGSRHRSGPEKVEESAAVAWEAQWAETAAIGLKGSSGGNWRITDS